MKLVVLNSCQGAAVATTRPLAGIAPQLVRAGIPAVVAMQFPFEDRAALVFAREFYLKLCTGSNRGRVDAAISHARNRLQMDFGDGLAFATPVLYMRSPTGVIFDLAAPGGVRTLLAPREDIHRLKEVKKAHQSNVAALQASGSVDEAAKTAAIAQEGRHIAAIDGSLRQYSLGIAGVVLGSWVLVFASWIGLFNAVRLDDWLERNFVSYMDGFVETPLDDRITLIVASSDASQNGMLGVPDTSWRCHHADLISGLSAAGAKVIAFDLYLENASDCDARLADAIRQASSAGTAVVVGAEHFDRVDGVARPVLAPALSEAVGDSWGVLGGSRETRRVKLADPLAVNVPTIIEERESAIIPSFALRTAMHVAAQSRNGTAISAAIDRGADEIRLRDASGALVKTIPVVDANMNMIVGLAPSNLRSDAYHEIYANAAHPDRLARFKGKIVVVGYQIPRDQLAVSTAQGEPRYGVELQASAISNLLRGVHIQPLRPMAQFVVILIMGVAGALVRKRSIARRRLTVPVKVRARKRRKIDIPLPLVAAVVVYALVAFLAYKQYRVIFDISYHVVSLVLMYAMIGWVRKGIKVGALPKQA
jgi:CHASE2 domain-containing sensor protein